MDSKQIGFQQVKNGSLLRFELSFYVLENFIIFEFLQLVHEEYGLLANKLEISF
jgi:hypothetical protein